MTSDATAPARSLRWILPLTAMTGAVVLSVDYRTSPPAVNALVLAIGALAAALIFLAVWAGTMSRSTCPACWNRIEPSFNLCPRCGVRLR